MTGVAFDDIVMGLDIDTQHIGWAVLRGHDHVADFVKFPRDDEGRFLTMLHHWIKHIVQEHRPAVIGLELPFVGQPSAVGPLYKMHGVTEMALAGYIGAVDRFHSGTWKKQVCGRGNITTKEKKAGLIVEIVNRMGFKVTQIDAADALCIALHSRNKLTGRLV